MQRMFPTSSTSLIVIVGVLGMTGIAILARQISDLIASVHHLTAHLRHQPHVH